MSDVSKQLADLTPEKRDQLLRMLKEQGKPVPKVQITPARDPSEPAPLSFAQHRLWFLSQLDPDSPEYNNPLSLGLRGPLDVAALERSFDAIVARHAVLRATFVTQDGEPIQRVQPSLKLELAHV